jgi:hypothetical protein
VHTFLAPHSSSCPLSLIASLRPLVPTPSPRTCSTLQFSYFVEEKREKMTLWLVCDKRSNTGSVFWMCMGDGETCGNLNFQLRTARITFLTKTDTKKPRGVGMAVQ